MMIPTVDSTRNTYNMQLLLNKLYHVVFPGPTGTGKSYTLGTHDLNLREEQHGLLLRILDWIFDWADAENGTPTVRISFLEIYKEELYDLLQSGQTKVEIKNSDKGKIY